MSISVSIRTPPLLALDAKLGEHRVRQLRRPAQTIRTEGEHFTGAGGLTGVRLATGNITIASQRVGLPRAETNVLLAPSPIDLTATDLSLLEPELSWIRPPVNRRFRPNILARTRAQVLKNWEGRFRYVISSGDEPGLRPPQSGALHGVLAHWTVSENTATVVMPTGTGKTETMMALMVAQRISPLIVVVPSRLLRDQIAAKFLHLGVLPEVGVVPRNIALPIVATLQGSIQDEEEATSLLTTCHVIVSTMQGLTRATEQVRQRLVDSGSYLMIDEAHHVPARTWAEFRAAFSSRHVVQFTATPFRSDNKLIPGRPAYRYPLRKAQEEGYFRPITFHPIWEFDPGSADRAIAAKALELLELDLAVGLDHIVMARTRTIDRAEQLRTLYESLTERRAVVVHHRQGSIERRQNLSLVLSRDARIVICVDMLGEGYDLPALKIAALHDPHRGLGITLQFIGRFTRTADSIGNASVVANIADPKVEEAISELYSQDADWSSLLRELSEGAVGREVRRAEFLEGFTEEELKEVPLQNIYPKMSTVAYRIPSGQWQPKNVRDAIQADHIIGIRINAAERVAVVVTRHQEKIAWADIASLRNVLYDLLLLHFEPGLGLLFIHSSDTSRLHFELAAAVCGDGAQLVRGTEVFRVLSGISRLVVASLGLRAALNRSVRFTMYAGPNVHEGLTEANFQNRTTSNLFGFGFEGGERASIGCSYKGRLWSYRIADDIGQWVEWCHQIGAKLNDETIDTSTILRTTMTVQAITERPARLVPLSIEWSDNLWIRSEETVEFQFGEPWVSLLEVGIDLTARDDSGPIGFRVFSEQAESRYEARFGNEGVSFARVGGPAMRVRMGRGQEKSVEAWLLEDPPIIRFHDGQQLVRDLLLSAPTVDRPFSEDGIATWDWTGTDLTRESQGPDRDPTSIQRRVIDQVLQEDWDVVFNDDGTNEAADIVTIKVDEETETLRVRLFHCKYSSGHDAGHRVADLYEVCGQAQRNVHWKGDRARLLEHLARRDGLWARNGRTRFEKGDQAMLAAISRRQRFLMADFEVTIVQPGLSKKELTDSQRDLLAATQLYLMETYAVPLRVLASE
jgi:superfamily II DNA or RNA helicase